MKRSELFFALILIPVDVAMIIAAFSVAYYLRTDLEVMPIFTDIGIKGYLRYSLYLIPLWISLFALEGLYYIRINKSFLNEVYRILTASSTAISFLIMIIFLSQSFFFSRLILAFTWMLSIIFLSFGRLVVRAIQSSLFRYNLGVRNLVLVGDNGTAESIILDLSSRKNSGYKICGVVSSNGLASKHGVKVLGHLSELPHIMSRYSVDEIIVTDANLKKTNEQDILNLCADHHAVLKYVPDIFTLTTARTSMSLMNGLPVMELRPTPLDGWARILKRLMDVIFSSAAIILSAPAMLVIVILIKLTSSGPIIYKHERVGRDGKFFDFYKFRSMYTDKCDYKEGGSKWTTQSDDRDRVTPIGRILRKSSLDELPQFFNVLKGDMSFVGPRPEQPKFVEQFQKEIPEYFRRHRVKSGLTGWAQVNGLKGDTSIKERVKYDIYYIENWSIWFDLTIISRTIGLILSEISGGKAEYRGK